jgi:segregation and condensation protein B
MNSVDAKRVLETALICAPQPVTVRELRTLFDDALGSDTLKMLLLQLQQDWALRGVELVQVATAGVFKPPRNARVPGSPAPGKAPRYTRATLETLAIIAYQPVTRGDIEDIRGVTVNQPDHQAAGGPGLDRGHRPPRNRGRPALFATTRQFLDDLGLQSLDQLPMLDDPAVQATAFEALADAPEVQRPDKLEMKVAWILRNASPGQCGHGKTPPSESVVWKTRKQTMASRTTM